MDNRSKPASTQTTVTRGPIKRVMIEEVKAAIAVAIICALILAWSHLR